MAIRGWFVPKNTGGSGAGPEEPPPRPAARGWEQRGEENQQKGFEAFTFLSQHHTKLGQIGELRASPVLSPQAYGENKPTRIGSVSLLIGSQCSSAPGALGLRCWACDHDALKVGAQLRPWYRGHLLAFSSPKALKAQTQEFQLQAGRDVQRLSEAFQPFPATQRMRAPHTGKETEPGESRAKSKRKSPQPC